MSERAIAELPPGPPDHEGGFRLPKWPIAELPPGPELFQPEAVQELFRLRDRVHALESQALATKLSPQFRFPVNPVLHELPRATEFYRFQPVGVLGGPNELPPPDLYQALQGIFVRLAAIEATLNLAGSNGEQTARS